MKIKQPVLPCYGGKDHKLMYVRLELLRGREVYLCKACGFTVKI